ncbi:1-aminocyclopropane-1-carboxylate deaminase/D-cysteine desulfhydrase [Antarcticibacterium sp. 1MA-6-2]|uniref:1-aminocyclopropane-1-carboxylate deaminase/D-cysteine desulfhydrase n=1 Tax=Antarcticibacterium sp. 1MA-6-2 TaxID=2908210 RepID=UPI0038FD133D
MEANLDFQVRDSPVQHIKTWKGSGISLYLKREDQLHSIVSGNKFRKLKYNLQEATRQGIDQILTFGGAFSNHIAAVAAAGNLMGFKTLGIIRGEELGINFEQTLAENSTLNFAAQQGMKLEFVTREQYRAKDEAVFQNELREKFGDFYLVPEGGTNKLAVKGCEEILAASDKKMDFVCTAVGTGGTISGIINSSEKHQQIIGFPSLKGDFLTSEIRKWTSAENWKLVPDYHFGGYAKISPELVEFINHFRETYQVQLDPVYTGKMLYGIFDLVKKSYFPPNSLILAIHTGGLQGLPGMNAYLRKKNLPLIHM